MVEVCLQSNFRPSEESQVHARWILMVKMLWFGLYVQMVNNQVEIENCENPALKCEILNLTSQGKRWTWSY